MSDHLSTQELINRIESKDRKFRLAQSVFMILLLATLTGVIFVQFRTLNAVKEQLIVQKATSEERSSQNRELQDKIIRRLDCMVQFFSQPDRSNLTIENINQCSLNRNEDVQQFFQQPESTPSQKPNTVNPTAQPEETTMPEPSEPPAISNNPVPIEPRPPKRILGIPLCVPFTESCLR